MEAPAHLAMVLNRHAGGNGRVAEMLMLSVGRIIKKAAGDDPRATMHALGQHEQAIRHVADWFKAAHLEDASWIANVDDLGRPKKLMKFGSIDRMVVEADKVMLRKSHGIQRRALIDGAEEVVATLDEGFSIVRLLTPEALDAESVEMQHCIGHGAYDDRLEGNDDLFLSLRDQRGRAHATVHIERRTVVQISGKQNAMPVSRYFLRLASYLTSQGFYLGDICTGHCGWIVDVDGNLHPMDGLPDELRVPGNVYIEGSAPASIIAGGNVVVGLKDGDRPPLRIETPGGISLVGSGFKVVPDIRCGGELVVSSTMIESLPRGLSVKGLTVMSTPLKTLPDDIVNIGHLFLEETGVSELPDSLWQMADGKSKSYGRVSIYNTPISSLGSLEVAIGELVLVSTDLKSLPDGLEVGGNLRIYSRNPVEFKVPKQLSVDGSINIDVRGDLTFLGDDFKAPNALSVCGENIRFPRAVSCGSLSVIRSTVRTMPRSISVRDSFNLGDTEIDRFPRHIEASKVGLRRVTLTSFLGRMRGLSGVVKAKSIMLDDRPLKIGGGVGANAIMIVDEKLDCVTMTVGQARSYFGAHKRHARQGGLPAFAELTRAPVRKASSVFFMSGRKAANGRPIVYDEFHRSAQ
jgi:hypothetical protein